MRFLFLPTAIFCLLISSFQANARTVKSEKDFFHEPVDSQDIRQQYYNDRAQSYTLLKSAMDNLQTDKNIDIIFYHIALDVTPYQEHISGNTYIVLCSLIENLQEITLNLHASMTVESVVELEEEEGEGTDVEVDHTNAHVIKLTLNDSYSAGDTVKLRILYHGYPVVESTTQKKGFRFLKHSGNIPAITALSTPFLAHYWFPCKDGPYDKADSIKVDITVPDIEYDGYPLMGVSNGLLYDDFIENEKRTWRWKHNYPIVPYYINVSISNYKIIEDEYYSEENGHDFPLIHYVFPHDYSTAKTTFGIIPDVFDAFIHYFGDYPFKNEKYGMTQIAAGLTYIEKQTNSIMTYVGSSIEWLVIHELSHMWFGNSITNRPWKHVWLNEGFATYAEALYEEYRYTKEEYHDYMNETLENWRIFYQKLYLEDDSNPANVFQEFFYHKGAWVLHTLRYHLGDELFFDIIKSYAQAEEFKYKYVDTETFKKYVETHSGLDLEVFFDQWIYDTSFPEIRYNFAYDSNTGMNGVTIAQIQDTPYYDRDVYEMYLPLRFTLLDGTVVEEKVYNNKRVQSFHFDHGKGTTNLVVDPDKWNMLWSNFYNSNLYLSPAPMITSFTFEDQVNNTITEGREPTIHITMPEDTDLESLQPVIELTDNTTVYPASGVSQDFSWPVEYTVTGENHSQRTYTVYVSTTGSDDKDILTFKIPPYHVSTTIDNEEGEILVVMPQGIDLSSLKPEITVSINATIDPASGEAQDFSSEVVYTVTAENKTKKLYKVKVEIDSSQTIFNDWLGNESSDWNDDENWSLGIPENGTDIHIGSNKPNYPEINSEVNINNITLEPGAVLVQSSGILDISGIFTLESSADENASYLIKGGNLNIEPANIKIEQSITSPQYNYALSSPVWGPLATRANSGIEGTTYIYNNPTNQYTQLTDEEFVPGVGMVLRNPKPIEFSGELNTGTVKVDLTRTPAGLGWNFIGNPYTAAVNWESESLVKSNVDNMFWIYNNESGVYATYNGNSGIGVGLNDPPYLIPSNHAFWVRVTQGKPEGSITFDTSATVGKNFSYLKSGNSEKYPFIKLLSFYNGNPDETAIVLIPDAGTNASDIYDNDKMFGSNKHTADVYTISQGKPLAINALPPEEEMTIALGVYVRRSGGLSLLLKDYNLAENTTVLLKDKYTGETRDLTAGEGYRAYLQISPEIFMEQVREEEKPVRIDDRYEIIIKTEIATYNNQIYKPAENHASDFQVYNSEYGIVVHPGKIEAPVYKLYDITGRLLSSDKLIPDSPNFISIVNNGIYLLTIIYEDKMESVKIVY